MSTFDLHYTGPFHSEYHDYFVAYVDDSTRDDHGMPYLVRVVYHNEDESQESNVFTLYTGDPDVSIDHTVALFEEALVENNVHRVYARYMAVDIARHLHNVSP